MMVRGHRLFAATTVLERNDRVVLLIPRVPQFAHAVPWRCLIARTDRRPRSGPAKRTGHGTHHRDRPRLREHALSSHSPTMLLKLEAAFHKVRLPDGAAPSVVATDRETPGADRDQLDCGADDIAFLQYTSGSTANPRGVVVGHDNLMDNLGRSYYPFEFDKPAATMVNWLPAYHDMGLIGGLARAFVFRLQDRLDVAERVHSTPAQVARANYQTQGNDQRGP